MKKFKVFYGLGGGFGGATEDDEIYEFANKDEAIEFAREKACEEYDDHAGLHGLRSIEEIMEEEGLDEDEAIAEYKEERESWLDYEVEEIQ
jgi:hypothetical protein